MALELTTIFTPPSSCSTHWTYEAELYNSMSGGLLIQNAFYEDVDKDCFPSGLDVRGRLSLSQVYSPGHCPVGYSTPTKFLDGAVTTAVCCYSSVNASP